MNIFKNKLLALLLWPLSLVYGTFIRLRNLAYDAGILRKYEVGAKIISIGNIRVGGAGKTPATIFLAEKLLERGFQVAILSRGYGRVSKGPKLVSAGSGALCSVLEAGDEPYMMAQKTSGIPILVDNNRVNGAKILVQKFSPEVILLDDGFQHRRLSRNIDIVLINAKHYYENRFLLPAGPLRESMRSLKRADLVYVVCDKSLEQKYIEKLVSKLKKHTSAFFFQCTKKPLSLLDPIMKTRFPVSALKNKNIYAIAGIANPQNFADQLMSLGASIEGFQETGDHYKYSDNMIQEFLLNFERSKTELFVTTEKDWVKLKDFPILKQKPVRILEIVFSAPEISIDQIIERLRK